MGTLLLGLVVGSAIGFVMGRRRQTSNTAAVTPAPMRPPVAPSSPGPVVPPLAAPNKKAKKVGLTETDFQPSDDILLKMQQAWEQGGRLDPESDAVVVPPQPREPSVASPEATPLPAPTLDPTLDNTMRRVFERLEGPPSGKGTGTMDETGNGHRGAGRTGGRRLHRRPPLEERPGVLPPVRHEPRHERSRGRPGVPVRRSVRSGRRSDRARAHVPVLWLEGDARVGVRPRCRTRTGRSVRLPGRQGSPPLSGWRTPQLRAPVFGVQTAATGMRVRWRAGAVTAISSPRR
jgi:hypothetical protein